jgi:2-polyprenyl-3-methyl-5-hydroxy-6-metoxy-1,4-benzoquinol methylase
MTDKFSEIYENDEWGFGSGVGSLPLNNVEYIRFVKAFIEHNRIRSVVDVGCGDWQFSRFIDWTGVNYVGLDVVDGLVSRNQRHFAREGISFRTLANDADLPSADLLVCKDVLQHLPNASIRRYLDLFKARARFLLITNDDWPAEELMNTEIAEGQWRPVRLDRPPFSEVAPIVLSWTLEWGGWKPTRKATCLIAGDWH